MSLENAKQFISDCSDKSNENLKDIVKNVDSNFESIEAKSHYLAEKAKQLGYNFSPNDLLDAFKHSKNKDNLFSSKIKDTTDKAKKFWDSLF